MPALPPRAEIALAFQRIAIEAGEVILRHYGAEVGTRLKADRSPVTDADEAAEAVILERLSALLPGVPVVAEESAARGVLPDPGERFVLVDPLDGTKEFLSRNGEFTVNIALVEDGRPVVGCVTAPAVGVGYRGVETERGTAEAWRVQGGEETRIATRPYPAEGLLALCSRSHMDPASEAFLAGLPVAGRTEAGSSLKFCRVAEGAADVYPRFGPTMEWDVAAGHAVLAAAGGTVLMPDGTPFAYGKRESGFRNEAFVAWGGREPYSPA